MVIIPDSFTFVSTPRTGSRALSEALLREFPRAVSDYPRDHHTDPSLVPTDYEIYTVIREPISQLISWYNHVDVRQNSDRTFDEFVREYSNPIYFPRHDKYKLNIYAEIADRFFVYEHGLDNIAKKLGIQQPLEVVGESKIKIVPMKTTTTDFIRKEFAADFDLYQRYSNE